VRSVPGPEGGAAAADEREGCGCEDWEGEGEGCGAAREPDCGVDRGGADRDEVGRADAGVAPGWRGVVTSGEESSAFRKWRNPSSPS